MNILLLISSLLLKQILNLELVTLLAISSQMILIYSILLKFCSFLYYFLILNNFFLNLHLIQCLMCLCTFIHLNFRLSFIILSTCLSVITLLLSTFIIVIPFIIVLLQPFSSVLLIAFVCLFHKQ